MNRITFDVNNNTTLIFEQEKHDGNVVVKTEKDIKDIITPGDFVMLLNLYQYIKDNDIQNDFINPRGKNTEE